MAIDKTINDRIGLTTTIKLKKELQYMADTDGRKLANYCVKVLSDHVEQMRKEGKIPDDLPVDDGSSE